MGFLGAQRFALRVQRGRLAHQRRHVREPTLRVGCRRGDAHEDPLRQLPGERADEDGRRRSREAGHREPHPGRGKSLHERPGVRELAEAVEQKVERHQRLMEATASSMAASSRAKPSSKPLTSDRKSTRLNSSHLVISYAVFCLKKKKKELYIFQSSKEDAYDSEFVFDAERTTRSLS